MSRNSRRRALMGSALFGAALATLALAHPAQATFPGKNGRLAIMGMPAADPGRMFTIARDGTDFRELSGTAATYTSSPVWSPDGRRIAYAAPLDEHSQRRPHPRVHRQSRRIGRAATDEPAVGGLPGLVARRAQDRLPGLP